MEAEAEAGASAAPGTRLRDRNVLGCLQGLADASKWRWHLHPAAAAAPPAAGKHHIAFAEPSAATTASPLGLRGGCSCCATQWERSSTHALRLRLLYALPFSRLCHHAHHAFLQNKSHTKDKAPQSRRASSAIPPIKATQAPGCARPARLAIALEAHAAAARVPALPAAALCRSSAPGGRCRQWAGLVLRQSCDQPHCTPMQLWGQASSMLGAALPPAEPTGRPPPAALCCRLPSVTRLPGARSRFQLLRPAQRKAGMPPPRLAACVLLAVALLACSGRARVLQAQTPLQKVAMFRRAAPPPLPPCPARQEVRRQRPPPAAAGAVPLLHQCRAGGPHARLRAALLPHCHAARAAGPQRARRAAAGAGAQRPPWAGGGGAALQVCGQHARRRDGRQVGWWGGELSGG